MFGGGPGSPPPLSAAAPVGPSDAEVQTAAANERARLRLRKGRAATILTQGVLTGSDVGGKGTTTLLGGGA